MSSPVPPDPRPRSKHLRPDTDEEVSASYIELFFDLVFVFAVTQLSHYLLTHLNLRGALETAFLLLVVWWAWIYTTWTTTWFDPESPLVRIALIVGMLCGLLMSIAIPDAFGARAPLFVGAYVVMQLTMNGFKVAAVGWDDPAQGAFKRILVWESWTGLLFIAGAVAHGNARYEWWVVALIADYAGPFLHYWNPVQGGLAVENEAITASHFVERFQLFVIVALGESIVITGATTSALEHLSASTGVAFGMAFVGTAALWWLYFDEIAEYAAKFMSHVDNAGRLGRDAYTYGHIPIIAGVIVTAVGDELVIANPLSELGAAGVCMVAGGPIIYLLGHTIFRLRMIQNVSRKRLTAIALIATIGVVGDLLSVSANVVASLVALVLVALCAWEFEARPQRTKNRERAIAARRAAQTSDA